MERLNVIIFSKDRACQLDLLLRSIMEFVNGREQIRFSVLYTASGPAYAQGYERVKELLPKFHFVDERQNQGSFRSQTFSLIDPAIPLLMFLVDDDVFKHSFSLDDSPVRIFEADRDILCISLRLGLHIDYCYSRNQATPPPLFQSENVWHWRGMKGDWGYPMSLDGHIFRTKELLHLLKFVSFQNPNTLECALATNPLPAPGMICYSESRILNLPVNRVQEVFDNRAGDLDPEKLNDAFVRDKLRIRLSPFHRIINQSAHQEYPLELSKDG